MTRFAKLLDGESRLVALAVVLLCAAPLFFSDFTVDFLLTRTLILGIIAATTIFLLTYGGMVSLAQRLVAGVAAFTVGNIVTSEGTKGLQLGWNPWVATLLGVALAIALAALLGVIAARIYDMYFLMLTLLFAVIGFFFFFGQVTTFSGFGGINGIDAPPPFADNPRAIYYLAVFVAAATFAAYRALARTTFGLALQCVRDDPLRMAALGFNVTVHRSVAMTFAGVGAAIGGVLLVWWNRQVDPTSIGVGPTLEILMIAVIGGLSRLSGAWLGAFVFVIAQAYIEDVPGLEAIGIDDARFNTALGLLVLLIVCASPDGIVGLISRLNQLGHRLRPNQPNRDTGHPPQTAGQRVQNSNP